MSLRLIKHVLFLSPVHSFAAGDLSHLCPPKYLLHFLELSREGGLFHLESLWMDLKGLGPSLATLARCFRISVVFCGAWNVPCKKATRLHEDAVLMAIDSSTPSAPKRETACLGMRHLVMTSIDSRGFLLSTRVSRERVWDLKSTNTRAQNDLEHNTNGCLFLRVADIPSSV